MVPDVDVDVEVGRVSRSCVLACSRTLAWRVINYSHVDNGRKAAMVTVESEIEAAEVRLTKMYG